MDRIRVLAPGTLTVGSFGPAGRGATVDLVNSILAYVMAGALVFWLIGEDRERERSSRLLGLVAALIVALLFVEEDREYHWWISGFVLVVLAAEVIALGIALLGPLIPGPSP